MEIEHMSKRKVLTFAGRALKNLFQKPATTSYPFEPAVYPERMRGHVEIHMEDCICCGLCMRSCPSQAIRVDRRAGTWTIRRFDCVQCSSCVNVCPKKCLTMEAGYTRPDTRKTDETFIKPAQPEEARAEAASVKAEEAEQKQQEKQKEKQKDCIPERI